MTLKADLAAAAVTALQDIRCAAARLCIEDVLKRRKFSASIPEYRVYVRGTQTPITSFDQFLTHITETNITMTYDLGFVGNNYEDKCKPVTILINNLEARFMTGIDEDNYFTTRYGVGASIFTITLNYVSDNDTLVPLKVIESSIIVPRGLV